MVAGAALGDADEAFAWLEKAYADREVTLPLFRQSARLTATSLMTLPVPLRRDPRYQALLRKVGLE